MLPPSHLPRGKARDRAMASGWGGARPGAGRPRLNLADLVLSGFWRASSRTHRRRLLAQDDALGKLSGKRYAELRALQEGYAAAVRTPAEYRREPGPRFRAGNAERWRLEVVERAEQRLVPANGSPLSLAQPLPNRATRTAATRARFAHNRAVVPPPPRTPSTTPRSTTRRSTRDAITAGHPGAIGPGGDNDGDNHGAPSDGDRNL